MHRLTIVRTKPIAETHQGSHWSQWSINRSGYVKRSDNIMNVFIGASFTIWWFIHRFVDVKHLLGTLGVMCRQTTRGPLAHVVPIYITFFRELDTLSVLRTHTTRLQSSKPCGLQCRTVDRLVWTSRGNGLSLKFETFAIYQIRNGPLWMDYSRSLLQRAERRHVWPFPNCGNIIKLIML